MIAWCKQHITRSYIDPCVVWGVYKLYNLYPDHGDDIYRFVFVHDYDLGYFSIVWGSYAL